jgi:hypothetical protein
MRYRASIVAIVAAAALSSTYCAAQALDEAKYPDLKGQWVRVGGPNWIQPTTAPQFNPTYDPRAYLSPPPGLLTPEYQAIYDANRADQAAGGVGDVPSTFCIPQGMPMMMDLYDPMEIIVTPEITYILISHVNDSYRRIYTDGRDWPADIEPTYAGYSIGRWIDEDGDGRYDVLEVETRGFKGPRAYDEAGLPLHFDNQSIFKERIYRDKRDPNIMHDEMTTIDHALTRPWTVDKRYVHNPDLQANWTEYYITEYNAQIVIGKENYFLSAEGFLMPAKRDQEPPDLRYFKKAKP